MPRNGKNLTKAQIWSLLTNITDDSALMQSQIDGIYTAIGKLIDMLKGNEKAALLTEKWQKENMSVLSSKVPIELERAFDDNLSKLDKTATRSGVIADFVRAFCMKQFVSYTDFYKWLNS